MLRNRLFTFKLNDSEYGMINELAQKLNRTRSDAIRFTVQEVLKAMKVRKDQEPQLIRLPRSLIPRMISSDKFIKEE